MKKNVIIFKSQKPCGLYKSSGVNPRKAASPDASCSALTSTTFALAISASSFLMVTSTNASFSALCSTLAISTFSSLTTTSTGGF